MEKAGTNFINFCEGISGKIGSLIIDKKYVPEECDLPINTLVSSLMEEGSALELLAIEGKDAAKTSLSVGRI